MVEQWFQEAKEEGYDEDLLVVVQEFLTEGGFDADRFAAWVAEQARSSAEGVNDDAED
jgi:hypothetical protein